MNRKLNKEMNAKEFLKDQRYTKEDQSEGYILTVSELIDLLNRFSKHKNKELIEASHRLVDHMLSDEVITETDWMKVADLLKTNKK